MKNLIHDIKKVPKDKKLIVFDLDGTLTESKEDMDREMALLMRKLLEKKKVAVIGGGKYSLFQRQLLTKLRNIPKELLRNIFLFPTTSTAFYRYDGKEWQEIYKRQLSLEERREIVLAFEKTFVELNYTHPKKIYGQLIEDRETQVTFSALGQKAPFPMKDKWKKEHTDIKLKIAKRVQEHLPNLEVRAAGYTSIDVTRKGIDKEYGMNQIKEYLNTSFDDMLFVGDAFFSGGNDSAALRTGVLCFEVKKVKDTKKLIRHLLAD